MYKFNVNCGSNVSLENSNRTARRLQSRQMKDSFVFSHSELRSNVVFVVRIEETRQGESSQVSIGVMYSEPSSHIRNQCGQLTDQMKGGVWILNGSMLYVDGKRAAKYAQQITVSKGDTLGVMRSRHGAVHFFLNGEDQGAADAFSSVPEGVWGIVGLEWGIKAVTVLQPEVPRFTKLSKINTPVSPTRRTSAIIRPEDLTPNSPARKRRERPENTVIPKVSVEPAVTRADIAVKRPDPGSRLAPPPWSNRSSTYNSHNLVAPGRSPLMMRRSTTKEASSCDNPLLNKPQFRSRLTSWGSDPNLAKSITARTLEECTYKENCLKVLESLKIHNSYLDPTHDVCFCKKCHEARGDNLYYFKGEPSKEYGLPIGWYKFGLRTGAKAETLDVFNKWHVAFHGTKASTISSILNTGDLLMPGDVTLEGEVLRPPANHYDPEHDDPKLRPPPGHDIRQIYLSPSILYAGCDVYAPADTFWDGLETFRAHVALQVRIMPGTYKQNKETIGAGDERVDPKFSNKTLEWSTNRRGATVLVGLLVKIQGGDAENGASYTNYRRCRPRTTQHFNY